MFICINKYKRFSELILLSIWFSLGDLERVRQQLADSETEKQAMKQRIEQLQRNQQDLEQKVTSMQITVSIHFSSS